MPNEAFTLANAVTLYSTNRDFVQKYWNYLFVVAVAATTAMVALAKVDSDLKWLPGLLIIVAFVGYAIVNACTVKSSKEETTKVLKAIKQEVKDRKAGGQSASSLESALLQMNSEFGDSLLLRAHIAIDVVIGAILVFIWYGDPQTRCQVQTVMSLWV